MNTILKKKDTILDNDNIILLCEKKKDFLNYNFSKKELNYIKKEWDIDKKIIKINQYNRFVFIVIYSKNQADKNLEYIRNLGNKAQELCQDITTVTIVNTNENKSITLAMAEGMALANYKFLKHKSSKTKIRLNTIYIYKNIQNKYILELQNIIDSVYMTRNMVNEPFSHLKAEDLALIAKKAGENSGYKTIIYRKKKIMSMKMGGILAVNKGSIDGPTFTIMEWKPKKTINKNPIILIGKGVVFDTGGLSLKPTKNSMDLMKIDMGGAGTVIGAMYCIAKNKLPVHVIGLNPATDNRPGGNAYAPGDVVTMYDGTKVEVLNTDAEGRMLLADALSFAKKYKPELVIDIATLTGSAAATIGHFGMVSMHKDAREFHEKLKDAGKATHERLAELPFWSDYDELLNSDIADIKNIGGSYAGAITAGKFLSHFAKYPWIHIDLSCVYSPNKYSYRGKGATGMGVRLIYEFIKQRSNE